MDNFKVMGKRVLLKSVDQLIEEGWIPLSLTPSLIRLVKPGMLTINEAMINYLGKWATLNEEMAEGIPSEYFFVDTFAFEKEVLQDELGTIKEKMRIQIYGASRKF